MVLDCDLKPPNVLACQSTVGATRPVWRSHQQIISAEIQLKRSDRSVWQVTFAAIFVLNSGTSLIWTISVPFDVLILMLFFFQPFPLSAKMASSMLLSHTSKNAIWNPVQILPARISLLMELIMMGKLLSLWQWHRAWLGTQTHYTQLGQHLSAGGAPVGIQTVKNCCPGALLTPQSTKQDGLTATWENLALRKMII